MIDLDLRRDNPHIGLRAKAYRISVGGNVRLQDTYDIISALILQYDILVVEVAT